MSHFENLSEKICLLENLEFAVLSKCLYISVCLRRKIFSRDVVRFYLVEVGLV